MTSRHLSRIIAAPADEVYAFASDPENLPRWASGLAQSPVSRSGDALLVDSPMGQVVVRFAPHNEYGVLDHDVTLPSGSTVTNPVRILAHPQGSEIVFTVRQLELTDEQFERDCRAVQEDLDRLAEIMAGKARE